MTWLLTITANNLELLNVLYLNFIFIIVLLLVYTQTINNLEFNYIVLAKRSNPFEGDNRITKIPRLSNEDNTNESNNNTNNNIDIDTNDDNIEDLAGVTVTDTENNSNETNESDNLTNNNNLEGSLEVNVNTNTSQSLTNLDNVLEGELEETVELVDPDADQLGYIQNPIPETRLAEINSQVAVHDFLLQNYYNINYAGIENLDRVQTFLNISQLIELYVEFGGLVMDLFLADGIGDTIIINHLITIYGAADVNNVSDAHNERSDDGNSIGSNTGSDSGSDSSSNSDFGSNSGSFSGSSNSSGSDSGPGTPPNFSIIENLKLLALTFLLELSEIFSEVFLFIIDNF